MKTFVWDTSVLMNIKESGLNGYTPGYSLMKDLSDGCIPGPYFNIFPAIAWFEVSATISRKHREGSKTLRDFYILNEHSTVYPVDHNLVQRCADVVTTDGFSMLHGADLVFACIAHIEDAYLVTLDNHFNHVSSHIKVINLNESRISPEYRYALGA